MKAQCPVHGKPARLPEARRASPAACRAKRQRHTNACRASPADAADTHSNRRTCSARGKQPKAPESIQPAHSSSLAAVPAFLAGTISSLTSFGGNGGGRGGIGADGSSGGGDGGGTGPGTEDIGFAHSQEDDRRESRGAGPAFDLSDAGSSNDDNFYLDDEERRIGNPWTHAKLITEASIALDLDADTSTLPDDEYYVVDVSTNLPVSPNISPAEFMATFSTQMGTVCSGADMGEDVARFAKQGYKKVVVTRHQVGEDPKHVHVRFHVRDEFSPVTTSIKVLPWKAGEQPLVLPDTVRAQMQALLVDTQCKSTIQKANTLRALVEGWYQRNGYSFSYISEMPDMTSPELTLRVCEVRMNRKRVSYAPTEDEEDSPTAPSSRGRIDPDFVLSAIDVPRGRIFNNSDSARIMNSVSALGVFESISMRTHPNPQDPSKVDVEVIVSEPSDRYTVETNATWGFQPNSRGMPTLSTLIPGGTVTFTDMLMGSHGENLTFSVDTSSFLSPEADVAFNCEYRQPCLWGLPNKNKTTGVISAFSSQRPSGVFQPGTDGAPVPPVMVDRFGGKAGVEEQYGGNSTGSLNMVACRITARDESGAPMPRSAKQMEQSMVLGPPTTISDSGVDYSLYLQGALNRDTTRFLWGFPLGQRDYFSVEQGLGLGTGSQLFNRATASATRILRLNRDTPEYSNAPVTVVGHARLGLSLGELPAYEAFLLGGPQSVRGYDTGELATCRNFLETAVELRGWVGLPRGITQRVFAFAERGSDLGSSKDVTGNPSAFFSKPGKGSTVGLGTHWGPCRLEYLRDLNEHKSHFQLQYGERF